MAIEIARVSENCVYLVRLAVVGTIVCAIDGQRQEDERQQDDYVGFPIGKEVICQPFHAVRLLSID